MLGIGGAAPLLLAGCSDSSKDSLPLYYPDISTCINDGVVSESICRLEYNKAWQNHVMTAPRYKNSSDCQFDFKNSSCQPLASGEYIPTMEGYLLFKSQVNESYSGRSNCTDQQPQVIRDRSLSIVPVYIDNSTQSNTHYSKERSQSTYDSDKNKQSYGEQSKQKAQDTRDGKSSEKSSIKTTTKKRGGFGSKAAARGSWGG